MHSKYDKTKFATKETSILACYIITMYTSKILLYVVVFPAIFLGTCFAASRHRRDNAVVVGEYLYFSDTEQPRRRAEAIDFCFGEGAELAQVWNKDLYHQLRLSVPQDGSYWIDGIDRDDELRFKLASTCQYRQQFLDFSGMADENLELTEVVSCLSLVKGPTQRSSKIAAANCSESKFALCQFLLNGCDGESNGDNDEDEYDILPPGP